MSGPTPPTYGDLGFSYEYSIDIDMDYDGNDATPEDWAQVAFITNAGDSNEKTFVDVATYFDRGAQRQAITGDNWGVTFDHQIQRNPDGTFIDVLDKFVQASKFGRRNAAAKVHVRFYDSEGADYAFEGVAYVSISRANRGNNEVASYTITLTGDGTLTEIANPLAGADLPNAVSVLPASGAAATQVIGITGTGFVAVVPTTGVKIGGVNMTSWTVDSPTHITAVMPAGSSGAQPLLITTAAGADPSPLSYTRA